MESISFPHPRSELSRLHRCGRYSDVERCCQENLAFAVTQHGELHLASCLALYQLATAYFVQPNYPAAEQQTHRALEVAREVFGENSFRFVTCLSNLALLQIRQGRHDDADATLRQASILLPTLNQDRDRVAGPLFIHRAKLLMARNDLDAAEPMLLEAIRLAKHVHGNEHPNFAMALDHLSELYQLSELPLPAERAIRKAINVYRAAKYEESVAFAYALGRHGSILYAAGRPLRARRSIEDAAEILRRVRPKNHFDVERMAIALNRMEHGFPPFPRDEES